MSFEIFRTPVSHDFHHALIDFDGTLSLIRENWQDVQYQYFLEILRETPRAEDEEPEETARRIREFVSLLTGKATIYECAQLVEEIKKRGGIPESPSVYLDAFERRLQQRIEDRVRRLESGADPTRYRVAGTIELLEMLQNRDITLSLISGNELSSVQKEAELLGVDSFFSGRIYSVHPGDRHTRKSELILSIIRENGLHGLDVLGIGDGVVEIDRIKRLGGYTIGVASDEFEQIEAGGWKLERLIRAGADIIVPNYVEIDWLESLLFVRGRSPTEIFGEAPYFLPT